MHGRDCPMCVMHRGRVVISRWRNVSLWALEAKDPLGSVSVLNQRSLEFTWSDKIAPPSQTALVFWSSSVPFLVWISLRADPDSRSPSEKEERAAHALKDGRLIGRRRVARCDWPSQLEAVAMAFFSCCEHSSRVRDSSSRSWQVLHTRTGSYSCWSGMGSFRWQQSLQNTFPQFLREIRTEDQSHVQSNINYKLSIQYLNTINQQTNPSLSAL